MTPEGGYISKTTKTLPMSNAELIKVIEDLTEAINQLRRSVDDNTSKISSNNAQIDHLYNKMEELGTSINKSSHS
ncbi:MAG: hypothetical protein ABUL44_02320 [Flavobacterium sp.]